MFDDLQCCMYYKVVCSMLSLCHLCSACHEIWTSWSPGDDVFG